MSIYSKLKNGTAGAALTEYAALVGLVGVVVVTSVIQLGTTASDGLTDAESVLVAQGLGGPALEEQGPPAPAAAQTTPAGLTGVICVNASPWVGDGSGGWAGWHMYNTGAIWFDTSPAPATTPNGTPFNIMVNDANGDGLMQESEAQAATYLAGADPAVLVAGPSFLTSYDVANPSDVAGAYTQNMFNDANGDLMIDEGDVLSPVFASPAWPFDFTLIHNPALNC